MSDEIVKTWVVGLAGGGKVRVRGVEGVAHPEGDCRIYGTEHAEDGRRAAVAVFTRGMWTYVVKEDALDG